MVCAGNPSIRRSVTTCLLHRMSETKIYSKQDFTRIIFVPLFSKVSLYCYIIYLFVYIWSAIWNKIKNFTTIANASALFYFGMEHLVIFTKMKKYKNLFVIRVLKMSNL